MVWESVKRIRLVSGCIARACLQTCLGLMDTKVWLFSRFIDRQRLSSFLDIPRTPAPRHLPLLPRERAPVQEVPEH